MIYDHAVKVNGICYPAGANVPEEKAEPEKETNAEPEKEANAKPEKGSTKAAKGRTRKELQ